MECNSIPPSRTSSQGPIEFCGKLCSDRNLRAADIKWVQFVGRAFLLVFCNVHTPKEIKCYHNAHS